MRALPGWAEVESDAVAFVVMGEDRLLLALEPPEGTQAQPLTLGSMQVSSGSHSCTSLWSSPLDQESRANLVKTTGHKRASACYLNIILDIFGGDGCIFPV